MVDLKTARLLGCLGLLLASVVGADTLAITDVRLFDGETLIEDATVVVRDGLIAAVGPQVAVPAGAEVLSRPGSTLLPGLIDSHGHSWGDSLERAAVWGVTTVIDMFTTPDFASARRAEQADAAAHDRADLVSAGVLATAPGGHGTQFGVEIPTLVSPDEADAWVAGRVAEGSDFIKIVLEDGTLIGRPLPTLDAPTFTAVTRAAQQRGKLAVAHVTTLKMAEAALAAGVDGLVHLFRDETVPEDWLRRAAAAGLFIVPTLTVLESTTGAPSGRSLTEDPRLERWLTPAERGGLTRSFPPREGASLAAAKRSIVLLRDAGVPLLAGTDAPNPGTTHGASMHRELELLVGAGLTPAEALEAATSVPADVFGLTDRGRIEVGRHADLLLVDGDPLADITATRSIATVWKAGVAVERPEHHSTAIASRAVVDGPVAGFDSGELAAAAGFGWVESTDSMMGGKSIVSLEIRDDGAGGTPHSLLLTGEIRSGFAFPWAGAMYFPGSAPMTPTNLSGSSALAFQVRGDPGTYRVMMFAESLGQMPSQQTFEVTDSWSEVVLELAKFPGVDPAGATGILWTAGPATGPFRLQIDQIELRSVD